MKFQIECLQKSEQWAAVYCIQEKLRKNGFMAMLAGGAVRDAFLGLTPHDLDVVTDASLSEVKSLFKKVLTVGESFGVLRVIEGDQVIEVAQFRKESDYQDGRHPSLVSAGTPEEDAHRRDFTVNALFYDFSTGKVLDFVGGEKDLEQKIIRCVGEAKVRFQEDHLRILRAIRFSAQMGFEIDPSVEAACKEMSALTAKLSKERVQDELVKMLLSSRVFPALEKLWDLGLMEVLFAERSKNYLNVSADLKRLFAKKIFDKDLALALFMWDMEHPENLFQNLRWPKKNEKNIIKVLKLIKNLDDFFEMRMALQLIEYDDSLFREYFLTSEALNFKFKVQIENLKQSWQQISVNNKLPDPLIESQDLIDSYQGEKLGQMLKKCYYRQLETPGLSRGDLIKMISAGNV